MFALDYTKLCESDILFKNALNQCNRETPLYKFSYQRCRTEKRF